MIRKKFDRKSLRLKNYDYSQEGAYFVTLCIQDKEKLFGDIEMGKINLSNAGKMIQKTWKEIPIYYNGIYLDEFIIMPNHIHGIIIIHNENTPSVVGAEPCLCPIKPSLCPIEPSLYPNNVGLKNKKGQTQGFVLT